jgi:TAG lipase / steryl ester hydrolase / phospholipase A2 / LPA acyltransferase
METAKSERTRSAAAEGPLTYEDWVREALADDERSGAAAWRSRDASRRYDFRAIRFRYNELLALKEKADPHELLFYLNEGIHGNMGGMGRATLYNRARYGTKDLIRNYIAELADALERLSKVDDSVIPFEERLEFFRRAQLCFGRSALMLRGAGALGPFHVGVAKALLEQELLPNVISGASAGAFVAAMLGTHSREELMSRIESRPALTAYESLMEGESDAARGKRRLGIAELRSAIAHLIPDVTFQEAFELTGREINISVSPSELHQSPRLLNAITSPSALVRDAVLASCSIPGIFPPVTLYARGRHGERRPYVPSRRWVDGSISADLPERRLARMYGVNFFITSQTNPLVLWAIQDTGWDEGLLARFVELSRSTTREVLRATYPSAMRWLKNSYPLNLYARMAFSVGMQDYTSDVNILPRKRIWDPRKLLSILTDQETMDLIREGELATWPKIEMIRNCTRIGRALDRIELEYEQRHVARLSATAVAAAPAASLVVNPPEPEPLPSPEDPDAAQSSLASEPEDVPVENEPRRSPKRARGTGRAGTAP